MSLKVGADPELFALDSMGFVRPVHSWLPGTKAAPHKVNGGAVQVDGFAAEFNIDPAETAKEFDEHIKSVLNELGKLKPKNVTLQARPFVSFARNIWDETPAEYKELGCSPDWDADGNVLFSEKTAKYLNTNRYRTGSGHLHLGWGDKLIIDDAHLNDCRMVARIFDTYFQQRILPAGSYSQREAHYGKPTAHRPKPYGVELRVPSNHWLRYKGPNNSYAWMFDSVKELMDKIQDPTHSLVKLELGQYPLKTSRGDHFTRQSAVLVA